MAEWRSAVFRPCHYLAVDRRRRRLVLAVRGSLELSDIATDLTARWVAAGREAGRQARWSGRPQPVVCTQQAQPKAHVPPRCGENRRLVRLAPSCPLIAT